MPILIAREHWSPIEDVGPPPEYVPAQWDGPHVLRRIGEGFTTLRALPWRWGPAWFKTAWPSYQTGVGEIENFLLGDLDLVRAARNRTNPLRGICPPIADELERSSLSRASAGHERQSNSVAPLISGSPSPGAAVIRLPAA